MYHRYLRMLVLSVVLSFIVILYGEFRAGVETVETHGALFFHPDRLSVLNFDSGKGALSFTQAAADAVISDMKMLCFS